MKDAGDEWEEKKENWDASEDFTPEAKKYNGWTNYETWNVALYLNSDEATYRAVVQYANDTDEPTYKGFIEQMDMKGELTPDGIHWLDSGLDHDELDEMIRDHREED